MLPYHQHHGEIMCVGYRFGGIAYSCDINALPEESYNYLEDLDVWIVDALRYTPHPSHFSLEETLEAIQRVAPKRAILTHMHTDLDYDTLIGELPDGVEPAYDGMVLETWLDFQTLKLMTLPLSVHSGSASCTNVSARSSGLGRVAGSSPGMALARMAVATGPGLIRLACTFVSLTSAA